MAFPLELKAIGYGLAVFIAGYVVMNVIGTVAITAGHATSSRLGWVIVTAVGYLVPVVAGFVAAFFASTRRILHGTVGGSIGVLIMLAPAIFVPNYPMSGAVVVIATYVVLASLGAIFGNHLRGKVGP